MSIHDRIVSSKNNNRSSLFIVKFAKMVINEKKGKSICPRELSSAVRTTHNIFEV